MLLVDWSTVRTDTAASPPTMEPAPLSWLTVWLAAPPPVPSVSPALAATDKAPVPMAPEAPSASVPALTIVPPVSVLAAPSVSAPVPVFVREPTPVPSELAKETLFPLVSKVAPPVPRTTVRAVMS